MTTDLLKSDADMSDKIHAFRNILYSEQIDQKEAKRLYDVLLLDLTNNRIAPCGHRIPIQLRSIPLICSNYDLDKLVTGSYAMYNMKNLTPERYRQIVQADNPWVTTGMWEDKWGSQRYHYSAVVIAIIHTVVALGRDSPVGIIIYRDPVTATPTRERVKLNCLLRLTKESKQYILRFKHQRIARHIRAWKEHINFKPGGAGYHSSHNNFKNTINSLAPASC